MYRKLIHDVHFCFGYNKLGYLCTRRTNFCNAETRKIFRNGVKHRFQGTKPIFFYSIFRLQMFQPEPFIPGRHHEVRDGQENRGLLRGRARRPGANFMNLRCGQVFVPGPILRLQHLKLQYWLW
jgi:hypothetical protein